MTEVEKNLNQNNKYIFPSTLEEYLKKDLLIQYLNALDDKNLEMAMYFIEMDEITEVRQMILNLIKNELKMRTKERMPRHYPSYNEVMPIFQTLNAFIRAEKRTLTIFLANNKLTEYLKTLTDGELQVAEGNLYINDITADTMDILSAIRIEKEYRAQPKDETNKKVVL